MLKLNNYFYKIYKNMDISIYKYLLKYSLILLKTLIYTEYSYDNKLFDARILPCLFLGCSCVCSCVKTLHFPSFGNPRKLPVWTQLYV